MFFDAVRIMNYCMFSFCFCLHEMMAVNNKEKQQKKYEFKILAVISFDEGQSELTLSAWWISMQTFEILQYRMKCKTQLMYYLQILSFGPHQRSTKWCLKVQNFHGKCFTSWSFTHKHTHTTPPQKTTGFCCRISKVIRTFFLWGEVTPTLIHRFIAMYQICTTH